MAAPASRSRRVTLAAVVDDVLAHPALARAQTAFLVRSLTTGETLYGRNPASWLVPASTQKLLTAVAAGARLGWAYRFSTRLVATGPIVNGTLRGDLMVVGSGDPTINRRHADRVSAFDDWAQALKARGLRHIAGHVIGNDDAVEEPGWGIGWAWDDLAEGYGSAYGALQFNENEVAVTMGPGNTPGSPAVVYLSPANHGLLVDNQAVTVAEGAASTLQASRIPGTRFLTVDGRAPLGGEALSVTVAVANPTIYFTNELRAALMRHGIEVDGAGADLDEMTDRPHAAAGTTLLVDLSPPLSEIIDPMLKWSRNGYAETLLMALDATPPARASDGLDVLRETLESLGVAPAGYSTRDGSGLSRNDYLSAEALVDTLTAAWNQPALRDGLLPALPQSGRSGSLARRLVGTAAEGRVRAKTGSMSNVRSLAGYVDTAAGESLVFAFLTNGFDVPPAEIDARIDGLLLALVDLAPAH